MERFMVIRESGPAWDRGRSLREQAAWAEHADYMDRGAEDWSVLVGAERLG